MTEIREPLERLIQAFARLPGVGRRSAERMAMRLARDTSGLRDELIAALQAVSEQLTICQLCGAVTDREHNPCALCTDTRRERDILCVVEDPSDIAVLERAHAFRGRYFALMNKLSPMQGTGVPEDRIRLLRQRIAAEGIREVILALGTDTESDATVAFLRQVLAPTGVKLSRIAFGLPAGSEIAYADPVTLARALEGRTQL